jgi:hypothetical protein
MEMADQMISQWIDVNSDSQSEAVIKKVMRQA